VSGAEAPQASTRLGFPLVLKMLSDKLPHKTEAGAVKLGLRDPDEVLHAVDQMRHDVAAYNPASVSDRFLLEKMVERPVAELMVSVRYDPQFGFAMTLASGGVFVELIGDAVTILLPAPRADLAAALGQLRVSRIIDGYRGKPAADRDVIIDALELLAGHVCSLSDNIAEVEINPLFVLQNGVSAADVLMRVAACAEPAANA